jgi:MarR family transcriptional regulator, transcriptional regulator for hemolysin
MDPSSPSHQFEFVLNELSRRLRRVYNQVFARIGISYQQAAALIFLDRYGSQSQNELAERMELGKAALAALVDRMVEAGYVRRTVSKEDGRVRIVHLTPAARRIVQEINARGEEIGLSARGDISEQDRRTAIRVMLQMRENLRRLEDGDA